MLENSNSENELPFTSTNTNRRKRLTREEQLEIWRQERIARTKAQPWKSNTNQSSGTLTSRSDRGQKAGLAESEGPSLSFELRSAVGPPKSRIFDLTESASQKMVGGKVASGVRTQHPSPSLRRREREYTAPGSIMPPVTALPPKGTHTQTRLSSRTGDRHRKDTPLGSPPPDLLELARNCTGGGGKTKGERRVAKLAGNLENLQSVGERTPRRDITPSNPTAKPLSLNTSALSAKDHPPYLQSKIRELTMSKNEEDVPNFPMSNIRQRGPEAAAAMAEQVLPFEEMRTLILDVANVQQDMVANVRRIIDHLETLKEADASRMAYERSNIEQIETLTESVASMRAQMNVMQQQMSTSAYSTQVMYGSHSATRIGRATATPGGITPGSVFGVGLNESLCYSEADPMGMDNTNTPVSMKRSTCVGVRHASRVPTVTESPHSECEDDAPELTHARSYNDSIMDRNARAFSYGGCRQVDHNEKGRSGFREGSERVGISPRSSPHSSHRKTYSAVSKEISSMIARKGVAGNYSSELSKILKKYYPALPSKKHKDIVKSIEDLGAADPAEVEKEIEAFIHSACVDPESLTPRGEGTPRPFHPS
eukprot:GHVO01034153.1.p1 GENE.GHVO01034153.1~~GHVO01034153.1.p1  ORF type:complete len:597 (+),score=105.45 GHVO01034153.1:25-1815(+)